MNKKAILFATAAVAAIMIQTTMAASVTLSLVTESAGQTIPLAEDQALWQSPFRGWVTAAWPFSMRVGNTAILDYLSSEQRLLQGSIQQSVDSIAGRSPTEDIAIFKELMEEMGEVFDEVRPEDLTVFRLNRPSSARVDLEPGRHVLEPFGIAFSVARDGQVECEDPRVRVIENGQGIEVVCYPVVIRSMSNGRTVPSPVRITSGNIDLLSGMNRMLAEFETKGSGFPQPAGNRDIFRLKLYLPVSVDGRPYHVNGIPFTIAHDGRVTLPDNAPEQTQLMDNKEIILAVRPPRPPARSQHVAIAWFGAGANLTISADGASHNTGDRTSGITPLTIPGAGRRSVLLGALNVDIGDSDSSYPHSVLIWDAGNDYGWQIGSAGPTAQAAGTFTCRIIRLTENAPLPAELAVRLVSPTDPVTVAGGTITAGDDQIYSGVIAAPRGVWRVEAVDGPFANQPLGMISGGDTQPTASVSLFTVNNRGLFRRGDAIDMLWLANFMDNHHGTADWEVRLHGAGLDVPIARIDASAGTAAGGANGRLEIDTTAMAPGHYSMAVHADGVVGYPFRFRIVQREMVTDYEIFSYLFGRASPYADSPVHSFYGSNLASEPGLQPFLAEGNASLDPFFRIFTDTPLGPASERFSSPPAEEAGLMALASLGMRGIPTMPKGMHMEDWNPKHSLPEELTRLRRRLALYVQQRADVTGFYGVDLNWYATLRGYWEGDVAIDGHQGKRNAAGGRWIAGQVAERVAAAEAAGITGAQLNTLRSRAGAEASSSVLPNAYAHYLKDANIIKPGLTSHSGVPNFWLGGGHSYSPLAYRTLTHRNAVDYTDYCLPPWGNFRAPALLNMGNPDGQPTLCAFFTHDARSEQIPVVFGAVGRGLDGIAIEQNIHNNETVELLRILERFGSWFSAFDPLPDVAVYFNGWPQQKSVILHDLARMRRPGMLLAPEDVRAGLLAGYTVLFLAGVGDGEPDDILEAFQAFEANGGIIIKDGGCHADLPGRNLGFTYDNTHVHNGWGLAYPNGEWEFAHLWKNFSETRQAFLAAAFANIPGIAVTTPDVHAVISPLAGRESILCFSINQTLVPLEIEGRWRQMAVMPKVGELLVEPGWHIHDVLAGKPATVETIAGPKQRVALDFTRMEGALHLLTRREPRSMSMQTQRTAPHNLRMTAWLADDGNAPLIDPMPFEVTLTGPDNTRLFHKYAALSPTLALDIPIPAMPDGAVIELHVRDLVLGSSAAQSVAPAVSRTISVRSTADIVGGTEHVTAFITQREAPVTILLDEGQDIYADAAEALALLLRRHGRDTRIMRWDPADVRPLPLRWHPLEEDQRLLESVAARDAVAWRVDLNTISAPDDPKKVLFHDPRSGYGEWGPRLRLDGDIVLFGLPSDHRAVADLTPYLRRTITDNYPAPGGFFIHYLWSPFQGGYNGLYLGCRDAGGAAAALETLSKLVDSASRTEAPEPFAAGQPVITRGGKPTPLENLVQGAFGTRITGMTYSPSGDRLFVTTDAYENWFFVLDGDGGIIDRRTPPNRDGFPSWWRHVRGLRPTDETSVYLGLWDAEYLYDLEKGFLSRATDPPTGLEGGVGIGASVRMTDPATGNTYLGGARYLHALDANGTLLWRFDDMNLRTGTEDMLYRRSLFPRAVTTDGAVLLVAGFGIRRQSFSASAVNASVMGFDTKTGNLLWQADGFLLNQGKVIALDNRFLIIDDSGTSKIYRAADGRSTDNLQTIGRADWVLPLSGKDTLLVVENTHFTRQGRSSRVYIRPLDGSADILVDTPQRVTDVRILKNGDAFVLTTACGKTRCFDTGGNPRWEADTPSGGMLRLSPDGRTIAVGARDGILYRLNPDNGAILYTEDFNPFNVTDGERFVNLPRMGTIPDDDARAVPVNPPEPSYLASLDPAKVPFGPNLLPPETVQPKLGPGRLPEGDPAQPAYLGAVDSAIEFTIAVDAGKTYLVELMAAVADPAKRTAQTRLEIHIEGSRGSANLPVTGRLPLGRTAARRRMAFRTDKAGNVTLRLRAVQPRQSPLTYDGAPVSEAGLLIGELVVAAMEFKGPNLVYDGGPKAGSNPQGKLTCLVVPWTGGDSRKRSEPYPCRTTELSLVSGRIGNQETAWTTEASGEDVSHATAVIRLARSWPVAAVVIHEDVSGPVPSGNTVQERTAMHYGIYAREAGTRRTRRLGYVADNTNLVNIFPMPDGEFDEILYFWAGRPYRSSTDGIVRAAEMEVYATEDGDFLMLMDDAGTDDLLKW